MMRRVSLFAALAAMAAPLAAQSFEGTIWFMSSNADSSQSDTLVQMSKPGMVRIELHGADGTAGTGAAIIDSKAKTMTVIMNEQRMYMTQPIPKPSGRVDDENRDMAITETGRTETVAGVSCRVYETTTMTKNGVQKGEACFAKGIGLQLMDVYASFMGTAPFASGNATWDKLKAQDMQLLKVVSLKDGKPDHIVTAVKIDRTPVPASMFKPPEGFTRMEP